MFVMKAFRHVVVTPMNQNKKPQKKKWARPGHYFVSEVLHGPPTRRSLFCATLQQST